MNDGRITATPATFVIVTVLLLALMGFLLAASAKVESFTWDETGHIPHGFDYVRTGNFWFDQFHAALPRLLAGLPLLAVNPRVPTEHESYRTYDFFEFRHQFLFRNRVKPDTMLALARIPTMAMTLLLGLVLALWTRKQFGPVAALCALSLYALSPNFLAHGHYATTDLQVTAFLFFATISWASFLETERWRHLWCVALLTGLALATKHSAVFVFLLLPLLYLIRKWQEPKRFPVARLAVSMVVIGVVSVLVVGVVYWPVTSRMFHGTPMLMADHVDRATPVGALFHDVASALRLPYHPYLMGFYWIAKTNEHGFQAYLLGQTFQQGCWLFFPVCFAVKSTTAFLAGLALCAGAAIGILLRRDGSAPLRRLPFAWFVSIIPPAVYFAGCLGADINSGSRHLLPIYPFLFAFVGAILGAPTDVPALSRIRKPVVLVLATLLVFESARAYPDYLTFFNTPSGGADRGYEYLAGSSLDWGQGLRQLKQYMDREGIPEVCVSYSGVTDMDHYQIGYRYLPRTWETDARANLDCVAAVSVTHLVGLETEPGSFDWLREMEPDARIGHSIYVYDLRKTVASDAVQ